jgi:hypothetical protein
LQRLVTSGLYDTLDFIVILNYGQPIHIDDKREIDHLFTRKQQKILWIQRSDDITQFEIPTVRHLHYFAQKVHELIMNEDEIRILLASQIIDRLKKTQILYLHTKGVSYHSSHSNTIRDWRNMMLHFLVDEHKKCTHLLSSNRFDAVGVNYASYPKRYFSGNFWWATSKYISQLSELNWYAHKYQAEEWLLSSTRYTRVFILHDSSTNHFSQRYLPKDYAKSRDIVTPSARTSPYSNIVIQTPDYQLYENANTHSESSSYCFAFHFFNLSSS